MTPVVAVLHNLGFGGAWRRLHQQVRHLDLEVVEITTSAAEPLTDRPFLVPLRQRATAVPPALRPPLRYTDVAAVAAAWRRMGALAQACGADVVMTNPDRFLKGAVPSGVRRTPVVAYVDEPRRIDHEPDLRATLNPATRGLYAPLRRRERGLDVAAVAAADTVLTNSEYSRRRIRQAYGRDSALAACGVPDVMAGAPDRPGRGLHLLTVGAAIPTKGHDLVLRASAALGTPLPVVLVTGRDDDEVGRLRRLAAQLGVPLDVRIRVPDTELADLYLDAVATLYLSKAEPLGLVSMEAQARGCPVVVADEGGLPETVRDAVTGFVVPRVPEAAAAAVRRLLAGDVRERMGAAARATWAPRTWEHATAALREELLRAVGREHAHS